MAINPRFVLHGLTILLILALSSVAWTQEKPATPPATKEADEEQEVVAPEPALKLGSPAPPLAVSDWLNGKPVAKFEKGKIYVIEFWATWCGPCVHAMPHLSELNTKHKADGVVFIGMNLGEDKQTVEPFLKEHADELNYVVAIDALVKSEKKNGKTEENDEGNEPGQTAKTWFEVSGQEGIPCSFLVDREGLIAWIGHPMQLEQILDKVLAGKWDTKLAAEQMAKRKRIERQFSAASRKRNPDRMLQLADEMMGVDPEAAEQMTMLKFRILARLKNDFAAANKLATEASGDLLKGNAEALNELAWMMLDTFDESNRDLKLALKLAIQADDLTKHENAPILDTLARAQFESGDVSAAIKTQKLAVSKSDDERIKASMEESLKKYEEAAQEKNASKDKETKAASPDPKPKQDKNAAGK